MKRASFGPENQLTEIEFYEPKEPVHDFAAMDAMHEKDIDQLMAELPEDLKARILAKRKDALTYASSV